MATRKIIIPSKQLAEITDRLEDALITAIWEFAEDIDDANYGGILTQDDRILLEDYYYATDIKGNFMEQIDEMLKGALLIKYTSDGTDF